MLDFLSWESKHWLIFIIIFLQKILHQVFLCVNPGNWHLKGKKEKEFYILRCFFSLSLNKFSQCWLIFCQICTPILVVFISNQLLMFIYSSFQIRDLRILLFNIFLYNFLLNYWWYRAGFKKIYILACHNISLKNI